MSKDMIGSVVRAAVGVPQGRLDTLAKLASAMAGDSPQGEVWHQHLTALLKKGLGEVPVATSVVVRPDRCSRPTYPDWAVEVVHPELELSGPAEFYLSKVDQWLHGSQKNGVVSGQAIYEHLKSNAMLGSCLNLADLRAIKELGLGTFRKYFAGKAVFAWGSVVRRRGGYLDVPYLFEDVGEVVLLWRWLGNRWRAYSPALRFASQSS
jgi:hypothetical protein